MEAVEATLYGYWFFLLLKIVVDESSSDAPIDRLEIETGWF